MRLGKHKRRLYLLLVSDEIIHTEDLSRGLSNREKRVISKRVEYIQDTCFRIATYPEDSLSRAIELLGLRILICNSGIPRNAFTTLAERAGVSIEVGLWKGVPVDG